MKFGSLSITTTDGRTRDYPIDLPSLVIGRADGNSIVVDDLSVARRHARIIVDSGRLLIEDLGAATGTFIDGHRIPPNTPSLVEDGQEVRFGDVEVRYTAPVVAQGEGLTPPPVAGMPVVTPDLEPSLTPGIRAVLAVPPEPITPGGPAAVAELHVQNRGHVVDELSIEVRDLPESWVTLTAPSVVLRPGDETTVSITILPPRNSESRAGEYDFSVVVTSGESGREVVAGGQLRLLPFEATALSLHPVRSKKNFRLVAQNGGNTFATYAISASDDEDAFRYEFAAPSVELPAGQEGSVPFHVIPKKRKLFGPATPQPFTVLAKPANGGPVAQVQGQLAIAPPLEPLKRPAMFTAILMVLALGALAFLLLKNDNTTVKAAGTEAAYAGVHLCDKDTGKSDAPPTPTPTAAQVPAGASNSGGPYFAQNDPRWANVEYAMAKDPDFGPDWCGVTIAQCGCAMTSVTTVMALYDVLKMPDGSDLTPETVNAWFNGNATKTARGWVSQGYIYGDVIWTAANQLSGEIAKINPGSPTIRFVRAGTGSDEEIRSELKAGRPIVLEVPGHWISAVGLDGDKILINDPYYRDRKTLDAYAGKVKSSILFEKSDDLSAVVITVPASERVRVTDKQGNVVGSLNTGSPEDAAKDAKNQIPGASYSARQGWRDPTCIASPPPPGSGTNQIVLPGSRDDYKIEVLETAGGPTSVAIHTYDKTGTPSVKTIDNTNGDSVVASVSYDPAKTEPQVTVLNEKPESDSSSDRTAGKSPTAAASATTTVTSSPTVAPTATPTPSGPPTTILSSSSAPGAKVVNIASSQGFAVGDIIRFSPGASNEEDNTIVGFGSFILAAPLKFAHSAGEIIVRVAGVPGGGGAPPPVTTPQLQPPGAVALSCTPIYSSTPRSATLICTATVTGTYTTTRWSIDGRVQSAFTGQTVLLSVFSQDTTVAIAATACNVTMCASDAATQAIRFPLAPEAQSTATPEPSNPVTPTAPPVAIGVAADCTVNFTSDVDLSKALANLSCNPKSLPADFSSITWTAPGFIPDNNLTRTTAPFVASAPQTALTPGQDGNAVVPISATVCTVNSGGSPTCSVSPPTTVVIPYATTSLSILPDEAALDTTVSFFAVVKSPAGVIPNGGVVRFEDVTDPTKPLPIGLDVKVQQIGGVAFAQLNFHAGTAPLDTTTPAGSPRKIAAVYSGASNIFGAASSTVDLTLDPPIPDICNSIDDNGNGQVDESCRLPGDSGADLQKDAGSGTILTGIALNGTDGTLNTTPGATFTLSLSAQMKSAAPNTDPYCVNCKRQVYVGIGENTASVPRVGAVGPVCVMDQSLASNTTTALALPDIQLKAPVIPGVYYVRATSSVQGSCGQPEVGGPDASIARVIVKGNTHVSAPAKGTGVPDPRLGQRIQITSLVISDQPGKPTGFVAFCDGNVTPTAGNVCSGGNLLSVVPVTDTADHSGRQAVMDLDTSVLFANQTNVPFIPAAGNHNLTAHFLDGGAYANPFYSASDSDVGALNVLPAPASTTAKLVFGSNPAALGTIITLSVVVRSGPFGDFGGTVVFCDDSVPANPPPADQTTAPCGLSTQLTDDTGASAFPVSGSEVGLGTMSFDTVQLYQDVTRPNPIGIHNIRARYSGSGNYGASENSDALTVTPARTTVALTRTPSTAVSLGTDITGLAAVVASERLDTSGAPVKFGDFSGNVQFRVGTLVLGTGTVNADGTATCADCDTTKLYAANVSPLVNTTHIIQAYYMGAGNYGVSVASPPVGVPVTPSVTSIVVSVPQTIPGDPLFQASDPALGDAVTMKGDITATNTTAANPDFGALSGTIEFRSGNILLCSKSISGTPAGPATTVTDSTSCDTAKFYDAATSPNPVGPRPISARFVPGAGSLYAGADSATGTTLTLRPAPVIVSMTTPGTQQLGTLLHLTASLSAGSFGAFGGTVDFKTSPGGTTLGSATVAADGTAAADIELHQFGSGTITGAQGVTAVYNATNGGNYQSSNLATPGSVRLTAAQTSIVVTVDAAATTTAVLGGGTPVALKADLGDSNGPGEPWGAVSGTVQFKIDGSNLLTPQTVVGHVVTVSMPTSVLYPSIANLVGDHAITAIYTPAAGSNYAAGSSASAANLTVTPSVTSIAVSLPSSSTVALGESVSLKADLSGGAFGTVAGTITFNDGSIQLCSVSIPSSSTMPVSIGGGPNCDTGALYNAISSPNPIGVHQISAHFTPNTPQSNYGASNTTSTAALTITTSSPTMSALAVNPATTTLGGTVTLSVTIKDASNSATPKFGAFGNVTFLDGATTIATVPVQSNGNATIAFDTSDLYTSGQVTGSHTVTAAYAGSGNYASATSPSSPVVTLTVNSVAPTITVTAAPTTIFSGNKTTFTVNVAGSFGTPAGSITLRQGGTAVASTTALSSGSVSIDVTGLSGGSHDITAEFAPAGNSNYAAITSSAIRITVVSPTAVSFAAPGGSILVGTPVSLTATVSCPSCSPSTVGAGTIEFFEGGTSLHPATPVNVGSTSVTFNSAGTHNVYAHYAGSGNFGDSDSPVVALSVRVATTTTVSVTSPAIITQNTTLTANVAGAGGITVDRGTVQFFDGGSAIGSPANVSGGVATLTRAFSSSGNHTITAQYTGSGDFNDSAVSTAATLSVHVNTTTSVTVSGTPVIQGQSTTLNAGVSGGGSTTVTEGTVQFYDGGTAIGTPQTVSAGVATLTASFASSGTHTITAQYIASGVFDGSAVSSGATLTVQLAGTNIAISVTQPGGSGQVRVDVTITPTVYGNYSGTARLVEGGFTLTSGTVAADGTVRLTATMTTGSHTISVAFDGGGNYAASTSAAQPITVT